jgi:hypothetical protein
MHEGEMLESPSQASKHLRAAVQVAMDCHAVLAGAGMAADEGCYVRIVSHIALGPQLSQASGQNNGENMAALVAYLVANNLQVKGWASCTTHAAAHLPTKDCVGKRALRETRALHASVWPHGPSRLSWAYGGVEA